MRKISIKSLLAMSLVAGTLAAGSSAALAQDLTVKRVGPSSTDGDRTSYPVSCTDGSRGTIYIEENASKRDEFCAVAFGGKLRCRAKWSLEKASEYACKVAPK